MFASEDPDDQEVGGFEGYENVNTDQIGNLLLK